IYGCSLEEMLQYLHSAEQSQILYVDEHAELEDQEQHYLFSSIKLQKMIYELLGTAKQTSHLLIGRTMQQYWPDWQQNNLLDTVEQLNLAVSSMSETELYSL